MYLKIGIDYLYFVWAGWSVVDFILWGKKQNKQTKRSMVEKKNK